jgi:hypothetical protein
MVISVTYLRFTIEMQDSLKRKLQAENPSKDYLSLNQKGTGLVSKYQLRLVSNNKLGAFFI